MYLPDVNGSHYSIYIKKGCNKSTLFIEGFESPPGGVLRQIRLYLMAGGTQNSLR